jgi:hypothetical protein
VGGKLKDYWEQWERRGAHPMVVGMLRWGYRIPLRETPMLTTEPKVSSEYSSSIMDEALNQAVRTLLEKGAIEEVPLQKKSRGFYNRLFLRPKPGGKWRPILDLKPLNPYVEEVKETQETLNQIRASLRKGQWAISLDLTDAFFHIPMHVESSRLLRFFHKGRTYQYVALPFGLKTAPWVFSTVMKQVLRMKEMAEIQAHPYLDDWLVPTDTYEQGLQQAIALIDLCLELGLTINYQKSEFVPKQQIVFLGGLYNLREYQVTITEENKQKLFDKTEPFLKHETMVARKWQSVIGLITSQEKYTCFGRLRLRKIQWALKLQWNPATGSPKEKLLVTSLAKEGLTWWNTAANLIQGAPIRPKDPDLQVTTDASEHGWGGHSGTRIFHGVWSQVDSGLHINILEMKAVYMTLSRLKPPEGSCIMVNTDNTTVMAYINHQGGLVSMSLYIETEKLLLLAESNQWTLLAKHIPGHLNILADALSRRHQALHTEWTLNMCAVKQLFDKWGDPNVDLFATRMNNRLPVYVSPVQDPLAWQVDALSISWEGLSAYAYPPVKILPQVLEKVHRTRRLRLILIAPKWE